MFKFHPLDPIKMRKKEKSYIVDDLLNLNALAAKIFEAKETKMKKT